MPKFSPFLGANLKVVLLSVMAATTFWFFNALNKNYNARISYPLNFEFGKDSIVVMNKLPEHVIIDVSSGGWNLLRKTFWFNINPILITLDNPSEIKFLTRSSLMAIVSDQLSDLNINYLVTDTLHINIEKTAIKKVMLHVDSIQISLASNYRVVSPMRVNPDSVEIYGPQSIINTLGNIYPITVPRQRINQNFDRKVAVGLIEPKLMAAFPNEVNVTFDVEEFVNLTLPLSIEKVNFPTDGSTYLLDSIIFLNFWVKASEQKSISPEDFNITADHSMIKRRDSTLLPILMVSPENAYDLEYYPDTLKVVLRGRRK